MDIEYVDPNSLQMAPWNPREITDESLERLATLLDVHGFVCPIVARREDRMILGGHQRIKANARRSQPDKNVPVIFLEGISDAKAKAMNIALNNPAAQGTWDFPKLGELLQQIDTGQFDMPALTAFSERDIAELIHGLDDFKPTDEEPPRLDEKTKIKCPNCGHEFTT